MDHSSIVILVCCIYFSIMLGAGLFMMVRNKKASDYLVAGRKLNLPFTVGTLVAIQVGAGITLGGSTTGFEMGVWPGMWYSLGCGGGLILAGFLVAARLKRKESFVPMDFYEERYGPSKLVRVWAWISNVPSLLGIFIAQLLACGSILSGFGLPFRYGVILCAVIILLYSIIGGMWGIVLTDAIQTSIILISIPVIAIASYGLLNDHQFMLSDVFATPFIPRGTFVKFIYYVVPFFLAISVSYDAYLRYQSARDEKTARWGCIIAGFLVIGIGILTSSVGAVGRLVFPEVKEGIFSYLVIQSLPPVMAGIAIAAILGAAMSSGACLLVAMGAAFSRDLYNKFFFPQLTLDELPYAKLLSRLAVGISAVAGILFAQRLTNILDAIIIFNYPYMGSLLIPLLAGVLWKGATKTGAVAAIFTGGLIGTGAFLAGIPGPLHNLVHPELGLFIAYIVSLVVLILVSKLSSKTRTL